MEEETKTNVEASMTEVSMKGKSVVEPNKTNGGEDDKENTLDDGDFIKAERETLEAKDGPHDVEFTSVESSRDLLEAHEKSKELIVELERLTTKLKYSESHNEKLKDQILSSEEKLKGSGKMYEELELNHKKLQKQMVDVESNFNDKLSTLQVSLEDHASKHRELSEIKDSFESLSLESENSKKKILDLEEALKSREMELSELVKLSKGQSDDAWKRVNELELLVEERRQKIEELEKHIISLETKCENGEQESNKHTEIISKLNTEIEKFRSSTSSLESNLKTSSEKEVGMMESLDLLKEHRRSLEEALDGSTKKLQEAETLLKSLRSELKVTREKLEGIENDLEASGFRESEIIGKLKSAENLLEEQRRAIDEATLKTAELEASHEASTRDFELKINEAKSLFEKAKILENTVRVYEQEIADANMKVASLTEELHQSATKVDALVISNKELKRMVEEAEGKTVNSLSEIEVLTKTNLQLKNKVGELQELLSSSNLEKEATYNIQIASHMDTITELTEKHSRSFDLKSANEVRLLQTEEQLKKTISKLVDKEIEVKELSKRTNELGQRELEVKELADKITILEGQVNSQKDDAGVASGLVESRKVDIEILQEKLGQKESKVKELAERALEDQIKPYQEETLLKLQEKEKLFDELELKLSQVETRNEALAEANMKLTRDLVLSESEQHDLHGKLSNAFAEKDEIAFQYHLSNKMVEDLTQELSSVKEKLQSEASTVLEDNSQLHETKNKPQSLVSQLDIQLIETKQKENALKAEVENLKSEVSEKSTLQARMKELEEQCQTTESQLKDEVKGLQATTTAREADLTSQLENHMQKVSDRDLLNERILQLEQELQIAQTTLTNLKEESSAGVSVMEAEKIHSSEELEAKDKELVLLGEKIEGLEQKLLNVEALFQQKVDEINAGTLDMEPEVRSRDIGLDFSSPVKRESMKLENSSTQPSSSSIAQTTIAAAPYAMNVKIIIMGVALISIIVGVILGRKY